MKRYLLLITFFSLAIASKAQRGVNELGIGVEAALPIGDFGEAFNTGFGGSAKLLFGVTSGQVSFSTGYTTFSLKNLPNDASASLYVIPILLGYRQNINGFYFEPQAGVGIYGLRASYMGQSDNETENRFTWAAGIGYAKNSIDFGVRYQRGEFEDDNISHIAIRFGYNFRLGGSRGRGR